MLKTLSRQILQITLLILTTITLEATAQTYKSECPRNATSNMFWRRGLLVGYAYGLGGTVPLQCIDVSFECRNKPLKDVYAEIAKLHVTGSIGTRMTIIGVQIVGRDRDFVKLRIRKNERPSERVTVSTPIKLIRHAGSGSYPRVLELGTKCDKDAPQELSATLKIKYRMSHSTTTIYTKSYKLY
jgi:hypothetical protein